MKIRGSAGGSSWPSTSGPCPGPWDEGYLWLTQAYFKKGGPSYRIEVHGARQDVGAQVRLLAERLAAKAV